MASIGLKMTKERQQQQQWLRPFWNVKVVEMAATTTMT